MTTDARIVYLTNVRLSYPNLAAPQVMRKNDGTERKTFNAVFLLDANDPQFNTFIARCTEMAQEQWKEHAPTVLQMIYQERKSRCFSRGEEHINSKTMQVRDGYAGKMVISAGGERQPQAIDPSGAPVPPDNTMAVQATMRKLYGGCRVNVALRPWMQQNKHGNGIRCDIIAIQFARDDTPFGEAVPDVSGVFGAVEQPQGQTNQPDWMTPAAAPAAPFGAPGGLPVMPPFGAH